jgi:thiol:disulfide interchange protein
MARTDQRAIPLLLLAVAVTLVAARVGVRFMRPAEIAGAGVHWLSPADGMERARETGKPILYDFTAAWCQPCHQLEAEVFSDPVLAAQINERFVPVRVTDRMQEDGHNPDAVAALQQTYSVRGFPTVVFADSGGSERARMEGYRGRAEFERVMAASR